MEDIPYRVVDGVPLLGRLYRPRAGAEVLLVDVHGGAWTQGDRLNNAAMHHYLAERGIAVFALDFRMPPQAGYPAALEDVNFGIRWAKANQARLGLQARIVAGLGASSGGHQIVLTALRPMDYSVLACEAGVRDADASLAFVVACWPILDPLARYRMAKEKGLDKLVDAHHAFWPDEAAMDKASPQSVLERGDHAGLPPMLVIQGTADDNVEHLRADAFADRYRKAGGAIELHKFDGQPHAFITRAPACPQSIEANALIADYVQATAAAL